MSAPRATRGQSGDPYRSYLSAMMSGQYGDAYAHAEATLSKSARKKEQKGEIEGKSLRSYLHMGNALFWAGNLDGAIVRYDQAETAIRAYELRLQAAAFGESLGSALFGATKTYRPKTSDGILVNTYKALAFIGLGRLDDARVELNRADERTRRAVEYYEREIQRSSDRANSANRGMVNEANVAQIVAQNYPDIAHWDVYDDFINPVTVYLHGLCFYSAGSGSADLETALTSLERVAGMNAGNPLLIADLEMVSGIAAGRISRSDVPDMVWVICEDGIGPRMVTKQISFAVQLDRQMIPLTLLLPELVPSGHAEGGCAVNDGNQLVSAGEVASMDRVAQTEFKKRIAGQVTEGIVSMLARGAVLNEVQQQGGLFREIAGALYQDKTAKTEDRVWEVLPKAWYAIRVERPRDGILGIHSPSGRHLTTVEVPEAKNTLVVVRNPAPGSQVVAQVARLDGG